MSSKTGNSVWPDCKTTSFQKLCAIKQIRNSTIFNTENSNPIIQNTFQKVYFRDIVYLLTANA